MEYRIGDFSLVTHLPIKTLRYYHEIGLLLPTRIDAASAYRWYDEAGIRRAAIISLLKELEFSLEEIKEILGRAKDESELVPMIREKMKQMERQIVHYRQVQNQLAALLANEIGEQTMKVNQENVAWTALEELRVASIRYQGRYDQIGQYFGKLFQTYGRAAAGAPMALYHDPEYREGDADIEACLPLRAGVTVSARDGMDIRILPAIRVAQFLHRGPYDDLHMGYRKVYDFLSAAGAQATTPSREIYLKGPGFILPRSPKRFLTLLQVPTSPT